MSQAAHPKLSPMKKLTTSRMFVLFCPPTSSVVHPHVQPASQAPIDTTKIHNTFSTKNRLSPNHTFIPAHEDADSLSSYPARQTAVRPSVHFAIRQATYVPSPPVFRRKANPDPSLVSAPGVLCDPSIHPCMHTIYIPCPCVEDALTFSFVAASGVISGPSIHPFIHASTTPPHADKTQHIVFCCTCP